MIAYPQTSRPSYRDPRFDRIEIWRNEVAISPICCVCSAPSYSSTRSATAGLYKSLIKLASSLSLDREDVRRVPSINSGSERSSTDTRERTRERRTSKDCTMCASPLDGVVYKWLSTDGSGLVRAKSDSFAEAKCHEAGWSIDGKGKKSLLKKVSQVLRHTKVLDLSRSNRSLDPFSTRRKTTTTTMEPPAIKTTRRHSGIPYKQAGTEMYQSLRPDIRLETSADDDEEEIGGTSDNGKKPKVGIDDSAARLRRAHKLLNKRISAL